MLYLLANWLHFPGVANLIRYQSFRAGAALMTALVVGLLIGPRFIMMLRMKQGKGQPIREDGPESHLLKRGTPTMGGLMILIALVISMPYPGNPVIERAETLDAAAPALVREAHAHRRLPLPPHSAIRR